MAALTFASCNILTTFTSTVKNTLNTGALGIKQFYVDTRAYSSARKQNSTAMPYKSFAAMKRYEMDRSRAINLVFLMTFSTEYFPYFVMYNPSLLPTTFQKRYHSPEESKRGIASEQVSNETKATNRRRLESAIKLGMSLETSCTKPPFLVSLNPFGRAAAQQRMDANQLLVDGVKEALGDTSSKGVIEKLLPYAYYNATTHKSGLDAFPSALTRTISSLFLGESFYTPALPEFVVRSQVRSYMKGIGEIDDFFLAHEDKEGVVRSLDEDDLWEVNCKRGLRAEGGCKELESYLNVMRRIEERGAGGTAGAGGAAGSGGKVYDKNAGRGIVCGVNALRNVGQQDSLVRRIFNNAM
jgi:hypothetical protein